jgi:hypothetical protein
MARRKTARRAHPATKPQGGSPRNESASIPGGKSIPQVKRRAGVVGVAGGRRRGAQPERISEVSPAVGVRAARRVRNSRARRKR